MGQAGPEGTRSVVVAVFADHALVRLPEVSAQQVASRVEWVADEALVVVADADGKLRITRSDHSVGRSLVVWTAKLLVAGSLGFKGVLATAVAGAETTAALRGHGEPTEVTERDLMVVAEQMGPGSAAVIATYPAKHVSAAVAFSQRAGAQRVWAADEQSIEAVVRAESLGD